MNRVAVVGASGFIGTRLCEMMHLAGFAEVRPVVRTASHLAPLSRFRLDGRVANALDERALVPAFAGCDAVIHSIAGSPEVILGALAPVYNAAQQAGVRRMVYLSTASVHGQNPMPGTTEETPLTERQPLPYNRAKVQAERVLRRLRQRGQVELVILRPGIVFGPRSSWVAGFADALLGGRAYLLDGGRGICNSLYVDNLVQGIQLSLVASGVDGQALFLGDQETVTWADLYQPIAQFLGMEWDRIPSVTAVTPAEWKRRQRGSLRSRAYHALAGSIPPNLRKVLSAAIAPLRNRRPSPTPWEPKALPAPEATLEMSLLYSCRYKLPHEKAKRLLGYTPAVTFQEACRRTLGWLAFAGYEKAGTGGDAWE
jgi:2-alkyl-3-oxoalkanoate reductase